MRKFAAVAVSACLWPLAAAAGTRDTTLVAPTAPVAPGRAAPSSEVRIAMQRQTLAPGGKLGEHRPSGERYLYVISGQLKVSNLITGEEQLVGAGKMAAEQPGDWHVAEAVGAEPATFYLIDRTPAETAPTRVGGN